MKTLISFFICATFLILVVNLNVYSQVDTLWTKTFGGNNYDFGTEVVQTTDGGYVLTGYTTSFGAGSFDVWLIKTNAFGDTLWTKTFGGISRDEGNSVKQTLDGGYIIVGETRLSSMDDFDIWLIKTDLSGNIIWTKTFDYGGDNDEGFGVQQTKDLGYIIIGNKHSPGNFYRDVWLIKTDASGDTLWTKTFGGDYEDQCYSVQQTTDGGYIITGCTLSFNGGTDYDVYLIKCDDSGGTIWTKTIGAIYSDEFGSSVQQSTDGGYIISGTKNSFSSNSDVWLIKTDSSGDTLWTKTYGGSDYEFGESVQQTIDGGYIITGRNSLFNADTSDVWLIKTDSSGDTLWTKTFGGSNNDESYSVVQTTDGGYILTGRTSSFGAGNSDIWLIKTTPDVTNIETNTGSVISNFSLHQNYPNPFNPDTKIKYSVLYSTKVQIKVYDILGKEIETLVDEEKPAGTYELTWNANNLPSGVYFYQLRAGSFIETKKMILLK